MSTLEYKSSLSRQARLFRRSRETWKSRAADKQRTIRSLRVKVRDLTASRDHWKELAQRRDLELEQLRGQPTAALPHTPAVLSVIPAISQPPVTQGGD